MRSKWCRHHSSSQRGSRGWCVKLCACGGGRAYWQMAPTVVMSRQAG